MRLWVSSQAPAPQRAALAQRAHARTLPPCAHPARLTSVPRRARNQLLSACAQVQDASPGSVTTSTGASAASPDPRAAQLKGQLLEALRGYVTGPLPAEAERAAQQLADHAARQPRPVTAEAIRGRWQQVANSSARLDAQGCASLAQLALGQFGPDVRVRLQAVTLVQGSPEQPDLYQTRADFEVVEGPHAGLRGVQVGHGLWALHATNPVRQAVRFTGVSLEPAGGSGAADLSSWLALMRPANPTMDDSGVARIEFPQAVSAYRDFLYYDQEVQITMGNRGSLVIVRRMG